jgi:hypothetical protein
MNATIHSEDRYSERVGGNKKSVDRILERVLNEGIQFSETSGSLSRYLTKVFYDGYQHCKNNRIYGRHIYIFDRDILVTVLNLPHRYNEIADKLLRKKRETLNINTH